MGYALDKRVGLAGSGSGNNKGRPIGVFYDGFLLRCGSKRDRRFLWLKKLTEIIAFTPLRVKCSFKMLVIQLCLIYHNNGIEFVGKYEKNI